MKCDRCGALLDRRGDPVTPALVEVLTDIHAAPLTLDARPFIDKRVRDGLAIVASAHAAQNSDSTTAADVPRQEV